MYDGNAASDIYTDRMWALEEERQRAVDERKDEEEAAFQALSHGRDYCVGIGQQELLAEIQSDPDIQEKVLKAYLTKSFTVIEKYVDAAINTVIEDGLDART